MQAPVDYACARPRTLAKVEQAVLLHADNCVAGTRAGASGRAAMLLFDTLQAEFRRSAQLGVFLRVPGDTRV